MTIVLEASESLRNSKPFKELLGVSKIIVTIDMILTLTLFYQIILIVGNYMNAKSLQGGAFGMRVSSLNKVSASNELPAENDTTYLSIYCSLRIQKLPMYHLWHCCTSWQALYDVCSRTLWNSCMISRMSDRLLAVSWHKERSVTKVY